MEWAAQLKPSQPPEAYAAVSEILDGLTRRLNTILIKVECDLVQHTQDLLQPHESKLNQVAQVMQSTSNTAGKVLDIMKTLIDAAKLVQSNDTPRKSAGDSSLLNAERGMQRLYDACTAAIGTDARFKGILPIAYAIRTLALEKDIAPLAEQAFDQRIHTEEWIRKNQIDDHTIIEALDATQPLDPLVKLKMQYYDIVAQDYLIDANRSRGKVS